MINKFLISLLILAVNLAPHAYAAKAKHDQTVDTLSSIGYGDNKAQAQQAALADLVTQLSNNISYKRCDSESAIQKSHCQSNDFYMDFPVLGAKFDVINVPIGEHASRATLTRSSVKSDYLISYNILLANLSEKLKRLNLNPNDSQLAKRIWLNAQKAEAYKSVLSLFSISDIATLPEEEITRIQQLPNKYAHPVQALADIPDRLILLDGAINLAFIHAPAHKNSSEMTPFSLAVRSTIAKSFARHFPTENIRVRSIVNSKHPCVNASQLQINCASNQQATTQNENGQYDGTVSLIGEYEVSGDDLFVTYQLIKDNEGIVDASFIRIPLSAVKSLRFRPMNLSFEENLNQNILPDKEFRAEISSNKGKRNILLTQGEIFELKIKLTQPGYFYLVGHIQQSDSQHSYLVEMNPYKHSFVGKIRADQANRWVSIGEFTIKPPFGVEHLQLIAANYNLSKNLPETIWSEALGYYTITGSSNDSNSALKSVRGFQRVCTSATRGFQRNCSANIELSTSPDKKQAKTQKAKTKKAKTKKAKTKKAKPLHLEHEAVLSYTTLLSS